MNPMKPISVISRIQNNSSGLTPIQSQTDGLVGNFTDQATDGKTLAAMTVGGMAYRLGKIGIMALGESSMLRTLGLSLGLAAK
jgi:hypothetical protein